MERLKTYDEYLLKYAKDINDIESELDEKSENYKENVKMINKICMKYIVLNTVKHNKITPIKDLLINKKDLYIINRIHGTISSDNKSTKENPYITFTIPDGIFFYYLQKVPYGISNFSNKEDTIQIISTLYRYIRDAYYINTKFKRNAEKIKHVLLHMQDELYRINQLTLTGNFLDEEKNKILDVEQNSRYHAFKKYSHIKPEITIYKSGNKIINKYFGVKAHFENGILKMNQPIFIANDPVIHATNIYSLFNYVEPYDIKYIKNNTWIVYYALDDIIKYLVYKKIHSCIFIDLSCSNCSLSNNVNTLITAANKARGNTYNLFNKIKRATTKRNKNAQFSPPKQRKSFFGW
jgi:hypothetical protein